MGPRLLVVLLIIVVLLTLAWSGSGRTLGNGTGRLPKGWGEIRGLNGVIKVFPSTHADGGQYRWERT